MERQLKPGLTVVKYKVARLRHAHPPVQQWFEAANARPFPRNFEAKAMEQLEMVTQCR